MKSVIAAVALCFAATVAGQAVPGLPDCAGPCVTKGLGTTKCQLTDVTCICNDKDFQQQVGACIVQACSPADQQKALEVSKSLCGASSPTTTPPPPPSTTEAPPPSTKEPPPTSTEVPPPPSSAPGHPTVSSSPCPSSTTYIKPPHTYTTSYVPSGSVYPAPSHNKTVTYPTPSAPVYTGAASRVGAGLGVVGIAVAGLFML